LTTQMFRGSKYFRTKVDMRLLVAGQFSEGLRMMEFPPAIAPTSGPNSTATG
jgi:hypothetical protein